MADSPLLSLRKVTKRYGRHHTEQAAVDALDLTIQEGEFLSILGPSGSGKSTCLMMLAGFEQPSSGDIFLRGARINDLEPNKRNFGVVFQSYALFPHMTVEQNVGYGLHARGVDSTTRKRRVGEMLELVGMQAYARRRPAELSGGQCQRVALARALAFKPEVLLLDEPLGALDRQLRERMQMELRSLHASLGTTFVYVTHDQQEALAMSDRIAVLRAGRLHQVSDANTLYEAPQDRFVASFIGESNEFAGTVTRVDGDDCSVRLRDLDVVLGGANPQSLTVGEKCVLVVRPERLILLGSPPMGLPRLRARIVDIVYLGESSVLRCQAIGDDEPCCAPLFFSVRLPAGASSGPVRTGQQISVLVPLEHARVFAA